MMLSLRIPGHINTNTCSKQSRKTKPVSPPRIIPARVWWVQYNISNTLVGTNTHTYTHHTHAHSNTHWRTVWSGEIYRA